MGNPSEFPEQHTAYPMRIPLVPISVPLDDDEIARQTEVLRERQLPKDEEQGSCSSVMDEIEDEEHNIEETFDGITLAPFTHQVGGHTTLFLLDEVTICKPLIPKELRFYQHAPEELRPFRAAFIGKLLFGCFCPSSLDVRGTLGFDNSKKLDCTSSLICEYKTPLSPLSLGGGRGSRDSSFVSLV